MQISDTAAIKTGLACSKTGITDGVNATKLPFGRTGFLVALGVECTLYLWNNIHGFNNLCSRTGQYTDCIHVKEYVIFKNLYLLRNNARTTQLCNDILSQWYVCLRYNIPHNGTCSEISAENQAFLSRRNESMFGLPQN